MIILLNLELILVYYPIKPINFSFIFLNPSQYRLGNNEMSDQVVKIILFGVVKEEHPIFNSLIGDPVVRTLESKGLFTL